MNKDIKEWWIEALRSGEYKQGTDWLNNVSDNTYCCLGVLCELAVKEGVVSKTLGKTFGPERLVSLYGNTEFSSILPLEVSEWAGVEREGWFHNTEEDQSHTLAALNDEGVSFFEIADIIADYF